MAIGGWGGWRAYRARRVTPAERERRRRLALNAAGRIAHGEIVECDGGAVSFRYFVAGVEYVAWQDVSGLEAFVPGDGAAMVGPAGVKFDPRNPADSIVVCEEWSGVTTTHSAD